MTSEKLKRYRANRIEKILTLYADETTLQEATVTCHAIGETETKVINQLRLWIAIHRVFETPSKLGLVLRMVSTLQKHNKLGEYKTQDGKPRTLGGIFFFLLKKKSSSRQRYLFYTVAHTLGIRQNTYKKVLDKKQKA